MRERQLWLRGIESWSAVPQGPILSPSLDARLRDGIAQSDARLAAGDYGFFARALPESEQFRLLPHAIEEAGCADVESGEGLTVIGVLDRDGPRSFMRDALAQFPSRAAGWKM